MSYDISLVSPYSKEVLQLPEKHDLKGGTYALGGTNVAELNVTYNYSKHFSRVLGEMGIRVIYGMSGGESIPLLEQAIKKLDTNISEDYWEATEGNARKALEDLLWLAKQCPDGIWDGD